MNGATQSLSSSRMRVVPIALSHGFSLICGLVGVRLITHLVTPDDYGVFTVFLSFTPVGMWFVHAGLIKFVGRHWANATDRGALLRTALAMMVRQWSWLTLVTVGMSFVLPRLPPVAAWLLLFSCAASLAVGALSQAALQAGQQHWRDFAVTAAGGVTRSLLPPLFYAFAGASVGWLCSGFLLHALTAAAAGLWCLRGYLPGPAGRGRIDAIYTGPLFVALALAGWVLAGVHRWIVAAFYGSMEAGYFSLAANLAGLVPSVLGTIALQYFQPGLFTAAHDSPEARQAIAQKVDRIAFGHALLSVAGLLLLKAIAPLLIGPLIGPHYRAALPFILPAGCGMLTLATGWFYHTLLLATKRERSCGPVELSAAAVVIGGSVLAGAAGEVWFIRWLLVSPAVPWILTRTLARRAVFKPEPDVMPAEGR